MMKLIRYFVSICSVATLLPLIYGIADSANACSITAPTHQLAITGDRNGAIQQNTVTTDYDDNCLGNTVTAPNNQVSVGGDRSIQTNQGNYWVGGGEHNQTGISSPVIEVTPTVQNQVYSPAYDRNFNPAGHLIPQ